jgi:hypothetical protein
MRKRSVKKLGAHLDPTLGLGAAPPVSRGKVIASKQLRNRTTGATASPYGAVPWTGAPGNRREDWEMEEVGFTISWPDGTVGIGRQPFATREAAEAWMKEHPRFRGMSAG